MRLAVPYQTLKWQAALLIRGVSAMPVALG
jgi:hypothetical protein